MWRQVVLYKMTVASEGPAAFPFRVARSSVTSVTFYTRPCGITLKQITYKPYIQFMLVDVSLTTHSASSSSS